MDFLVIKCHFIIFPFTIGFYSLYNGVVIFSDGINYLMEALIVQPWSVCTICYRYFLFNVI